MRRHDRERGAVAVEFALLLPLLLLLVVGVAELGRAYHVQTVLSGAARDAVRVMALYDDPDASRAAAKASATSLSLSDAQISVVPTTCAATGAASPGMATVTVTYPVRFLTGLLGADLTLTGKGTMRCNG